jgi:hypothetical protein
MSVELEYYADDEGAAVDLLLPIFGSEPVQCINLEAHSPDDKMRNDIQFLIEKQNASRRKSQRKLRFTANGCTAQRRQILF